MSDAFWLTRAPMDKPKRSDYTSLDFAQWQAAGTLQLSPKFQRRGVWTRPAQSYFIDSLMLSIPVPPIYVRVAQDREAGLVREIIDGQQRLRAVLSFMNDEFALSKSIESDAIGRHFSELSEEQRQLVKYYSFNCEVFYGLSDADVLRMFARLNTHSLKLNAQELRNGKFFGEFKKCCFGLAFEHLEFWRRLGIFSEQAIARMQEVELTSELVISILDGLQDKKNSINSFYDRFDDEFAERADVERKFRAVIDALNESVGDELKQTQFRRVPLFYSLFTAVAQRLFGLPREDLPAVARRALPRDDREGLRSGVLQLSQVLESARAEEEVREGYRKFVTACLRQTDNLQPRRVRLNSVYRASFE